MPPKKQIVDVRKALEAHKAEFAKSVVVRMSKTGHVVYLSDLGPGGKPIWSDNIDEAWRHDSAAHKFTLESMSSLEWLERRRYSYAVVNLRTEFHVVPDAIYEIEQPKKKALPVFNLPSFNLLGYGSLRSDQEEEEEEEKLEDIPVEERCARCSAHRAEPEHKCPFTEEMAGPASAARSKCTCCSECTYQCAMDV